MAAALIDSFYELISVLLRALVTRRKDGRKAEICLAQLLNT
jgi:hypothetical protein